MSQTAIPGSGGLFLRTSQPTAPLLRLQNVFPRKKFPRVERAITRGLVRQTRPRSLSGQWINEKLTLR